MYRCGCVQNLSSCPNLLSYLPPTSCTMLPMLRKGSAEGVSRADKPIKACHFGPFTFSSGANCLTPYPINRGTGIMPRMRLHPLEPGELGMRGGNSREMECCGQQQGTEKKRPRSEGWSKASSFRGWDPGAMSVSVHPRSMPELRESIQRQMKEDRGQDPYERPKTTSPRSK